MFSYSLSLTTLGTLLNFDRLDGKTFQPLIVIYRKGDFVYHHWVCKKISAIISSLQIPDCYPIILNVCLSDLSERPSVFQAKDCVENKTGQ